MVDRTMIIISSFIELRLAGTIPLYSMIDKLNMIR